MTTVRSIVTAAYLRSSLNDPGKLAGDTELVSHLDRVYQRMWALISRARPDQYNATTALTLAGNPAQVSLPGGIIDLMRLTNASGDVVNVIPATELARTWHLAPAVYRVGLVLRSRGQTGDPIATDVLTATYLDQPAVLATINDSLDTRWPNRHDQLLVDYLAVYLSVKDAGRQNPDRAAIAQELAGDVAAFGAEYNVSPSNLGWIHADAERAGAQ